MGEDVGVPVRIMTWNLQGRERPDLAAVAATVVRLAPDVVVLQEVQRRQAARLARRLGWERRWWLKHWPIVCPAEGLAVLAAHSLSDARRVHLAHRWRLWSSRRRVAGLVSVDGVRVVDIHLGSGVGDGERTRQALVVLDALDDATPAVIAGDCNTAPTSPVMETLSSGRFADTWAALHPDAGGGTNWPPGPRVGRPTQRLDYVLASADLQPIEAVVGDGPGTDWPSYGRVSDHVPVTVTLTVASEPGTVPQ